MTNHAEALAKALDELLVLARHGLHSAQALANARAALEAYRQPSVAIRLWDSQWVNVVNNPEVLSTDTEQAVSIAVKLTEKYMAQNYADNHWPPAIGGAQ